MAIVTSWSYILVRSVIAVILATESFDRTLTRIFCLLGFSERLIFGSLSGKQTRHTPELSGF